MEKSPVMIALLTMMIVRSVNAQINSDDGADQFAAETLKKENDQQERDGSQCGKPLTVTSSFGDATQKAL